MSATITTKLTAAERDLLEHAEAKIERGLETFFEVGQALVSVRENRLYREQYQTFEEYCEERWGFTGRRANQLVDAATVLELISGTSVPEINNGQSQARPDVATPVNEAQTRPLAPFLPPPDATPEERATAEQVIQDVWGEAVATAPQDANGRPKVTGRHVEEVAARRATPQADARTDAAEPVQPESVRKERRKPIPDAFRDAVSQLMKDVERLERLVLDDRWPKNASKVAPASRNNLRSALDLLAAVAERVTDSQGEDT